MLTIRDETFEGTFPFAPHYYSSSGFDMHYVDEGSGEPVLMVHSFRTRGSVCLAEEWLSRTCSPGDDSPS